MKSLDKLREDLRSVRCYYTHQKMFDEASKTVGKSEIVKTAEEYNAVMREAPARLYAVYVGLYVRNLPQESLAQELCYSTDYMYRLNRQLLQYLQGKLN